MRRSSRLITFGLAAIACLAPAGLVSAQSPTRIIHAPVVAFAPGARILLRATLVDEAPVVAFRCYFRETGQANFVFVDMMGAGANKFVAVLPAPQAATSAIEYVLLAANGRREVVRTRTFTMTRASAVEASGLQSRLFGWEVVVQTDLPRVPSTLAGFADQIALRGVGPHLRFGCVVRGLYADTRVAREGPAGYQGHEIEAEAPEALPPGNPPAGIGGEWAGGAVRLGSGIESPQVIREVKPRYTVAAMRTKTQGSAVVECVVLADGTVGATRVAKSLDPDFGLDDEAITAAKRWLFKPGTLKGEPVPIVVTIELSFVLR